MKQIGKGSFGEVYQGYDKVTGLNVAIKIVKTSLKDLIIFRNILACCLIGHFMKEK